MKRATAQLLYFIVTHIHNCDYVIIILTWTKQNDNIVATRWCNDDGKTNFLRLHTSPPTELPVISSNQSTIYLHYIYLDFLRKGTHSNVSITMSLVNSRRTRPLVQFIFFAHLLTPLWSNLSDHKKFVMMYTSNLTLHFLKELWTNDAPTCYRGFQSFQRKFKTSLPSRNPFVFK